MDAGTRCATESSRLLAVSCSSPSRVESRTLLKTGSVLLVGTTRPTTFSPRRGFPASTRASWLWVSRPDHDWLSGEMMVPGAAPDRAAFRLHILPWRGQGPALHF